MTRGGVRKGAGRPASKGETKSTNLAGVRVTPSQLSAYKALARQLGLPFSTWVTAHLDNAIHADVLGDSESKKHKGKKS